MFEKGLFTLDIFTSTFKIYSLKINDRKIITCLIHAYYLQLVLF